MIARTLTILTVVVVAAWAGWNAGLPSAAPPAAIKRGTAARIQARTSSSPPKEITVKDTASLLARVDALDATSLAAWAARLVTEPGSRETLAIVVERWAALDAKAAWQFYRRHPRPEFAGPVFAHLTAQDPVFAMKNRLREWEPGENREQNYWPVFNAIADVLSRMSPAQRAPLTKTHGFDVPWAMSKQIALRDPAAAAAFVESLPYGRGRDYSADQLLEGAAESDPAAAITLMARLVKNWEDDTSGVWQKWYQQDPQKALAWLNSEAAAGIPAKQADEVLKVIAKDRPEEAIAAARQLTGSARAQGFSALAAEMATRDVTQALALTEEIPESPLRRSTVAGVAASWSQTDFPAATAWVQQIEAPDYRLLCYLSIAHSRENTGTDTIVPWLMMLPAEDLQAVAERVRNQESDEGWRAELLKAVPPAP